ncbi:MAG: hypothetical protein IJ448_05875 [Oscillospiraceae bacterium]|nr:hypothetical protein [Oscillospiraceae bacterium]
MPANYAHYRFGKAVLPLLPPQAQQDVKRFRRLYDMGLHGPDIFFYHSPLLKTATGALGKKFHRMSGKDFFRHACATAKTEADRAYLYGLLGHYCLDSLAHPYVKKHDAAGDAGHVEMEVEFDRFLLEADGIPSPHTYDQTAHMKLTRGECVTVAQFYGTSSGAVRQSVRNMITASKLLTFKNRKLMTKVLSLTPEYVSQQQMHESPNERCVELNKGLQAYYERALKRYPLLLEQLICHMQTGEPLGDDFEPDFG